jgi:hypothetical protein
MATDQLLIALEDTPVSLERVPAFVLSEVTRDVYLFVAVAGVASDPNWYDGGPAGRFREYWARNSFGDLMPIESNRIVQRLGRNPLPARRGGRCWPS